MQYFSRSLFGLTPIGAQVLVGTDSVEIRGRFGSAVAGVLVLTQAQVISKAGTPEDGILNIVRIPVHKITFFAQL